MSTKDKIQPADGEMKSPSSPTASEGYKIIETKVVGTVEWFNFKNGFGFIKRRDTQQDIFVHHTAFKDSNPRKSLGGVGEGGTVHFDIVEGKKGPQAANVTVAVHSNVTSRKNVSDAHLDKPLQLEQECARLRKELQEEKDRFTKEMGAMKNEHEKDLQDTEATCFRWMEAQEVQAAKEQKDQEERFQKQLEAREASWEKRKAAETGNSWFLIFGGLCVAVGFLSAQCLRK